VPGNVDHRHLERRAFDAHPVALLQARAQMVDSLAGRAVDGNAAIVRTAGKQFLDTADVVVMMVRE
jgi:hypothetical protein